MPLLKFLSLLILLLPFSLLAMPNHDALKKVTTSSELIGLLHQSVAALKHDLESEKNETKRIKKAHLQTYYERWLELAKETMSCQEEELAFLFYFDPQTDQEAAPTSLPLDALHVLILAKEVCKKVRVVTH